MNHKALTWIVGDDTGTSSEAIWAHMMGVECYYSSTPSDPADLGRCLRLLKLIPRWKKRMKEMRCYPEWRGLIKHWDELEALMADEVGIDWSKGRSAHRTYEMMHEILYPKVPKAA